jgi:hypothetical protein
VGVVFHFLNQDLKVRSLLAGVRRVKGSHSGENIAEAIIFIFKEMISIERLGFFISDNVSSNNTAIRAILVYLRFNLKDPDFRRIRCLKYIINLTAKAFYLEKTPTPLKRNLRLKNSCRSSRPCESFSGRKNFLKSFITL